MSKTKNSDNPKGNVGNAYARIIEAIFAQKFRPGSDYVEFARTDIEESAALLNIPLPKNLGDLIYSFRYRQPLPDFVRRKAPSGRDWIIRPIGRSKYALVASVMTRILPNLSLARTSIPDATPGIIEMPRLGDEQALPARIRYNRLIDIFTGVTCYALQSHLRTTVKAMGQVETDELYVGIDRRGTHFVLPVQAKRGSDTINVVQIEQDMAMCKEKFPDLICIPIAACAIEDRLIALFAFEIAEKREHRTVALSAEKHYHLLPPEQISAEELRVYARNRLDA